MSSQKKRPAASAPVDREELIRVAATGERVMSGGAWGCWRSTAMGTSAIPSPEMTWALLTLGVPAWLLVMFATASAIKGWLDSLRKLAATGKKGIQVTGDVVQAVRAMPSGARAIGIVIRTLIWAVQGLLIGFMYLIGNYISMATTDRPRGDRLVTAIQDGGVRSVPSAILDALKLDPISGGVVAITVVCILISYQRAIRGEDPAAPGYVLALPAILLGWIGIPAAGLFAVFSLIAVGLAAMTHNWSHTGPLLHAALPMVGGLTACALYYGATIAGTSASGLFISTWWPSEEADSPRRSLLFWRR